eukprot:TRINITY_DN3502_c0_g1_i1.p1 TRINITY_DN3502_c0_g1~~TRINITY_DN3502_c0_g1_i1.p1  ORF type:complete len:461 (+),score=110.48 TRINITY_DN3502_c0_g1_i1:83-1465(+)
MLRSSSFLVLFFISSVFGAAIYDNIIVTKATRHIDLTTQFSRQNVTLQLESKSGSPSEFYFALESKSAKSVAQIDAFIGTSTTPIQSTSQSEETAGSKSFTIYKFPLASPLTTSTQVRVAFTLSHTQVPFPNSISQSDKQFVKYSDNVYVASPYLVKTQTTTVKLASSTIESKTEHKPTEVSGDQITYGPYLEHSGLKFEPLNIHFVNNKPFITVTSLQRDIEVSHWGNVAIEETYELRHDGAKLKGAFNRYDYQRSYGNAPAHIPLMRHVLLPGASDIYYRDEIGNISTSKITIEKEKFILDLTPRFPLFGGWRFGFYMGYNLPTSSYLFTEKSASSNFVLNITFGVDFEDASIDDITVRVILPEGASNIKAIVPFPVEQKQGLHKTYLDTAGRPTLVLHKKNLASNPFFQVTYTFTQTSLLQEPILLIGAFFAFFVIVMIFTRFEYNIGSKVKTEKLQ